MQAENRIETSLLWLRITGIAGIVGAILWTVGDALIIGAFATASEYPTILHTYAGGIDRAIAERTLPSSEVRLMAGALVADFGIAFYLAGSWHLFCGFLESARKWAWAVLALLVFGNAWSPLGHAGFYYLGMVYKTLLVTPTEAHPALIELAGQFHRILLIAWLLPVITLGLALLGLSVSIALGRTAWPRWFALAANPISMVAIGKATALGAPERLATWLGGAAFNLGWLAIYVLSTILLWNGRRLQRIHHSDG